MVLAKVHCNRTSYGTEWFNKCHCVWHSREPHTSSRFPSHCAHCVLRKKRTAKNHIVAIYFRRWLKVSGYRPTYSKCMNSKLNIKITGSAQQHYRRKKTIKRMNEPPNVSDKRKSNFKAIWKCGPFAENRKEKRKEMVPMAVKYAKKSTLSDSVRRLLGMQ